MKKFMLLLIFCLAGCVLSACAGGNKTPAPANAADANAAAEPEITVAEAAAQNMVEIKDKMFIAQCNDVILNPHDYEGKTIKVAGMYNSYTDTASGETFHYVNRNSPGCCGADGVVVFEFLYDGELPQYNDWIEVIGQVELLEEGGFEFVVLRLSQLTVKDERGLEFVEN